MTVTDIRQISLNLIELDGGTQSRAGFDESTLNEYIEAWEHGVEFPPIELFFDGSKYWLSDGFHRVASRQRAKVVGSTMAAIVRQGTRRDAVLASVGANATHGLRRSTADKRRAVETLVRDQEWRHWSDREIARRCGVGNKFVGDIRRSLCSEHSEKPATNLPIQEQSQRNYVTKYGNTATMRTGRIGKKAEYTESRVPSTIEEELQRQAKELGLESGEKGQLLPTVNRNHTSPADVDDRPFAVSTIDQIQPVDLLMIEIVKTETVTDTIEHSTKDMLAQIEIYRQATELNLVEQNELEAKLLQANSRIAELEQEVAALKKRLTAFRIARAQKNESQSVAG